MGVSYTWDEGDAGLKTAERPKILVRVCGDEVKVGVFYYFLLRLGVCADVDSFLAERDVVISSVVLPCCCDGTRRPANVVNYVACLV